jgi:hypothetical protein
MELKIKKVSGINTDAVIKKIERVTYVADLEYRDEVWSFFKVFNPDRTKNHKDFLLVTSRKGVAVLAGIDNKEFEENLRYHKGKYCDSCKDVIYSSYRHDMAYCSCGDVFVDGGFDYMRTSMTGTPVKIDFLTKKVEVIGG